MSIKAVHAAIERIQKQGEAEIYGPRSRKAIERSQAYLELTFPQSYVDFLSQLGAVAVAGYECFGLCNADGSPGRVPPDVMGAAQIESHQETFSRELIFVSSDGMGGYYVIDRSLIDSAGESPVRVWERGPGLTEYVADNFGDYFLREVNSACDDWILTEPSANDH